MIEYEKHMYKAKFVEQRVIREQLADAIKQGNLYNFPV